MGYKISNETQWKKEDLQRKKTKCQTLCVTIWFQAHLNADPPVCFVRKAHRTSDELVFILIHICASMCQDGVLPEEWKQFPPEKLVSERGSTFVVLNPGVCFALTSAHPCWSSSSIKMNYRNFSFTYMILLQHVSQSALFRRTDHWDPHKSLHKPRCLVLRVHGPARWSPFSMYSLTNRSRDGGTLACRIQHVENWIRFLQGAGWSASLHRLPCSASWSWSKLVTGARGVMFSSVRVRGGLLARRPTWGVRLLHCLYDVDAESPHNYVSMLDKTPRCYIESCYGILYGALRCFLIIWTVH